MALVLPILRLWILLLNLYGTFKVIKPPPASQRSTRNGHGPSTRAMQLRKRELKSRLAVWIVWAAFCSIEPLLDHTVGLLIPFYNELKCTILIFLLLSRSHGAEAIFLHIIHPLVRPYVPAIDEILAALHLAFELLTLLLFLPWEYISDWYSGWKWNWPWRKSLEPFDDQSGYQEQDLLPEVNTEGQSDVRGRLRPRNKPERARLLQANLHAKSIFEEIEEAQDQVRTHSRTQLAPRRARDFHGNGDAVPDGVGLRTRRRVLAQQGEATNAVGLPPGSRTTEVHHFDPTSISQLANSSSSKLTAPPQDSTPMPETSLHSPIQNLIPTPPSSHSGHEIWHPPRPSFEEQERPASLSNGLSHRTTSPVYRRLPSAYRSTPPFSDSLPPRPRTVTPQDFVVPTPRRASAVTLRHRTVHLGETTELFPGDNSGLESPWQTPSTRLSHASDHLEPEDFFQQALESSIQRTDMDVDTDTLSTRDDSSASEQSMRERSKDLPVQLVDEHWFSTLDMKDRHGKSADRNTAIRAKRKAISITPVRRSTRARKDDKTAVHRDEFGFSIRSTSMATDNSITDPTASSLLSAHMKPSGTTRRKPLARTKPALKPTLEEDPYVDVDTSDEESIKKKRRLKPARTESQSISSVPGESDNASRVGKTARQATVVRVKRGAAVPPLKERHTGTGVRTSQAAAKQPASQTYPTRARRNKGIESN